MKPVAVVTGAARGIGRAIAVRLAADGFALALVDVDPVALQEATALVSCRTDVLAMHADLTVLDEIARAVDRTQSAWGRIDAWVNNAGREVTAPFLEVTPQEWEAALAINLRTVFFATQMAARAMIAAGVRGRIVNIASIAGRSGRADQAPYAAAKAGVISVTRSAALALAPYGITVNAVCPGVVDTAMTRRVHQARARWLGITPEESLRRMVERIPLGGMARPEDVAAAVAFFCSPHARYITGQALNVCGGLEMD
ncbi:MAG: SDR family oxidoreductase [Armatimonadota bacterium]|nr:SDR family oxidoreductase [Armatimonadota bacterium]MDR7574476.1 SDR family oxidoreductase [Armatimonadota bacterium]